MAEQVEKVNPDLVARDDEGKPYTVRYEAVNAMLLNEFLKEHQEGPLGARARSSGSQSERTRSRVTEQQKQIHALMALLKEQAAQIQKVSAQLAAGKTTPRVVSNDLHTARPDISDSVYITGPGHRYVNRATQH